MLRIITPPPVEPVTVEEAKLHCRVDHNDEDATFERLITAARVSCESFVGRAFVERVYEYTLDRFPRGRKIVLPYPPVVSIDSVVYYDRDGALETMVEGDDYLVDTINEPAAVILPNGISWPSLSLYALHPIRVTYTAGYPMIPGTPDDYTTNVPAYAKQAILLCVGNWYEHREAVLPAGHVGKELPLGIQSLLWNERSNWAGERNE